jgi:BirA family biotin operon repressor/biotin-[acetyl-CoA-carboxylase] ligase
VDSFGSFDLKTVEAGISTTQFAGTVAHLRSTTSTNTLAVEAAQAGVPCGVWIADEQTGGRGRGGHAWHSAVGDGLYLSALITPSQPLPMTTALWLSLATGLAAKAAIFETSGLDVDIRWPNDLILNGRKCGGILVETAVNSASPEAPAGLRYAVIGVGINVNHAEFPAELAKLATSLRIEGGTTTREALAAALLCSLDTEIGLLTQAAAGPQLLARFAAASSWVSNKRVKIDEGGGYTGVTNGLDPQGFLRVSADDGTQRIVVSGGVREI